MKKLLNILGTLTLIGTSTTSLVACNTPQKYTKEELKKLKEENKIKTNNQEIRDNLEWIAPQEKPFIMVDNKYYFVVWRGDENSDWSITKFKNDIVLSSDTKRKLGSSLFYYSNLSNPLVYDLNLGNSIFKGIGLNIWRVDAISFSQWWDKSDDYFKAVYRWNGDSEPNKDIENKLKSYLDL